MPLDPIVKARIEEANRRHMARVNGTRVTYALNPQTDRKNLVVRGLRGLGDNINQRAFLKELDFPFYLDTPWPELYSDFSNIQFLKCSTPLRTQNKNLARQPETLFVEPPKQDMVELQVQYGSRDLQKGSVYQKLSQIFGGVRPKSFDLPRFSWPQQVERCPKVAVIRPATIRKEWAAVSRNPLPEYLAEVSEQLIYAGWWVVSVADLEDNQEWILEPVPFANQKFHQGELGIKDLLGLCQGATALCGGHGWLTHLALVEKKPMLCVMGGFLGDNEPSKMADPAFMDVSSVTFLIPDHPCMCTTMTHVACDKRISNFKEKAQAWIRGLG